MPFKSEAQRRYLFVHEPKIAHRWAHEYGTPKNLPMHKSESKHKPSTKAMKHVVSSYSSHIKKKRSK